ncbi:hypothetical protein [Flavobacterium sp. Root420]|uniref:hypothetical protein n=1 Tax=Flavobacterium sp. Root420 TaxID=1736533 RepID=UPI000B10D5D5|nr:hypothetical protein [Flavobacterium sp. Root420]
MKEEIKVEEDFTIVCFQNDSSEPFFTRCQLNSALIQFHFVLKGNAKFSSNDVNYDLELNEEKSLLLYNAQWDLPLHLELSPNSWVISVIVSINKFHALFSVDTSLITFLSPDNKVNNYYKKANISPSMAIVLSQLFHYNLHPGSMDSMSQLSVRDCFIGYRMFLIVKHGHIGRKLRLLRIFL